MFIDCKYNYKCNVFEYDYELKVRWATLEINVFERLTFVDWLIPSDQMKCKQRLWVSILRSCLSLFAHTNSPPMIFINQHFVEMDNLHNVRQQRGLITKISGAQIHSLDEIQAERRKQPIDEMPSYNKQSVIRVSRFQVIFTIIIFTLPPHTIARCVYLVSREINWTRLKTATHICLSVHNLNKLQNR